MIIDEVRSKVTEIVNETGTLINYGSMQYKENKNNKLLSQLYAFETSKLLFNKSVLDIVLQCLDPNNLEYNCFDAIDPILIKYYPNKKEWLPLLQFLLYKAKKIKQNGNQFDLDNSVLDIIMDEDGNFLPWLLTNEDRHMLEELGMNQDQISVVGKHCRSLYKRSQAKNQVIEIPKESKPIIHEEIKCDTKEQKALLFVLKRFLSLETYDVICDTMITSEDENMILSSLKTLGFSQEKIDLIKNKIKKSNIIAEHDILLTKIELAKHELFTAEMLNKYDVAKATLLDSNITYTYLRQNISEQINYIDDIILNYVVVKESVEDTIEYLKMAFEELSYSLSLCGPVKKRTLE